MADWLFNGAKVLGIKEIEIDVFSEMISPKSMDLKALRYYLKHVRSTIKNTLLANKFDENYIESVKLYFQINDLDSKTINCRSEVRDRTGKIYNSKTIKVIAYEPFFDVFRESSNINIMNRIANIFFWKKR